MAVHAILSFWPQFLCMAVHAILSFWPQFLCTAVHAILSFWHHSFLFSLNFPSCLGDAIKQKEKAKKLHELPNTEMVLL